MKEKVKEGYKGGNLDIKKGIMKGIPGEEKI